MANLILKENIYVGLLDWLAERETFYLIKIHTANPVGRANMERMIDRYWR